MFIVYIMYIYIYVYIYVYLSVSLFISIQKKKTVTGKDHNREDLFKDFPRLGLPEIVQGLRG